MILRTPFALALALSFAVPGSGVRAEEGGGVRGTLQLQVAGARLGDAGPTVVYLEVDGPAVRFAVPSDVPIMEQRDARFAPSFLTVTAGQAVELPNRDPILHNAFSYSRPNDFDLGLYPNGESRSIQLKYPGFVRVYCSIHESMSAAIFVVPSPWYDLASGSGSYWIRNVPPGRYLLRSWSQRLPSGRQRVEVRAGEPLQVDLTIGVESRPFVSEDRP